jgi:RNA polymerase sigma-70 factor (ECF subfamily)
MSFFSKPINTGNTDDEVQLNIYRKTGDVAVLGKLFEQYVPLIYGV